MQVSSLLKITYLHMIFLFQAKKSSIHCTLEVRFIFQLLRVLCCPLVPWSLNAASVMAMQSVVIAPRGYLSACSAQLGTCRSQCQGHAQCSKLGALCVLGKVFPMHQRLLLLSRSWGTEDSQKSFLHQLLKWDETRWALTQNLPILFIAIYCCM